MLPRKNTYRYPGRSVPISAKKPLPKPQTNTPPKYAIPDPRLRELLDRYAGEW
ncbi:hypothetical protein [Rossellomorea marisflavi]|uniref:hypothetical protein n=1 Tax=Rossellomorea marisflavi TaxID=189381 RepID=UPI0012E71A7C|nr:hypothetical protein [Rossellomorea marisflavi]